MSHVQHLLLFLTIVCTVGFFLLKHLETKAVPYRETADYHAHIEKLTTWILDRVKCRVKNGTSYMEHEIELSSEVQDAVLALDMRVLKKAGLGNFIYAVASLIGLSKKSNFTPSVYEYTERLSFFPLLGILDKSDEMDYFRLAVQNFGYVVPAPAVRYDARVDTALRSIRNDNRSHSKRPVVLSGYLQSWKYFQFCQEEIRARFTFSHRIYLSAVSSLHAQLKSRIFNGSTHCAECIPSLVGVHVRRGDIVDNSYGYNIASDLYIVNRVQYLRTHLKSSSLSVLFVVVSNDLRYCRNLLHAEDVVFISHGDRPEVDMALLTLMDHLILTVGTFGWWSAYLGRPKTVWAYKNWYRTGSPLSRLVSPDDYFLPDWNLTNS